MRGCKEEQSECTIHMHEIVKEKILIQMFKNAFV